MNARNLPALAGERFKSVLGFTSVMNITDDGLIEDNGDRWIRVIGK